MTDLWLVIPAFQLQGGWYSFGIDSVARLLSLGIEGRQRRFSGDFFDVQFIRQMLFNKVDRTLEPFNPSLHYDHSFPLRD